jgi:hypothetical protein
MKRAQFEYLKWIAALNAETFSHLEKHLLNLITENFEAVFNSGTYNGKSNRSQLIISLLESNPVPDAITLNTPDSEAAEKTNHPLTKIEIGPFKGFDVQREFQFGDNYTLFYGSNGTGKSSLCEGLEASLLGYVAEAERKRIPLDTYIQNTSVESGSIPFTYKTLDDGTLEQVFQSIDDYQYCFIEKNRIDDFSRISANTEKNQEAIILKLFGLDEFNAFVNGFTDSFANRFQKVVTNQNTFRGEISNIRQHLKQIRIHKNNIKTKSEEVSEILKKYKIEQPKDVVTLLEGDNSDGKIADLRSQIIVVSNRTIDVELKKKDIKKSGRTFLDEMQSLEKADAEIIKFASKIHYQSIYQALNSIKESGEDSEACPACETPLELSSKNPFDNAAKELEKLAELQSSQEARVQAVTNIKSLISTYLSDLLALNQQRQLLGLTPLVIPNEENTRQTIQGDLNHNIAQTLSLDFDNLYKEYAKARVLTKRNNRIVSELVAKNERLQNLIDEARSDLLTVKTASAAIEQETSNIQVIKAEISDQKQPLAEMKVNAKIEVNNSVIDGQRISAYTNIVANLKQYRSQLPSHLMQNLNDKTTGYYNAINAYDPDHYLAKEIKLPSQSNDELIIIFNDELNKEENALVVLSEGHIKCLGLAILLAKAEQENVPFIIFDDIVNAVDDDHRTAIREILTTHPEIVSKQQIISCHGQDFIRMLKEAIPSDRQQASEVMSYTFLDNKEGRSISVSDTDTCQNYIIMAEESYGIGDNKLCLGNLRKTLELLNKKVWKRLYNKHQSALTVKIWVPNRDPDLRSVCDALIKELDRLANIISDKHHQELSNLYKFLFPHWQYFNDGTHGNELLEEFEKPIVKALLDSIKNIEQLAFHGNL